MSASYAHYSSTRSICCIGRTLQQPPRFVKYIPGARKLPNHGNQYQYYRELQYNPGYPSACTASTKLRTRTGRAAATGVAGCS